MSDTPMDVSPRLQQFQNEVSQLNVTGGKANPERTWSIIGGLLMAVGIVLALVGYLTTSGSKIQGDWADGNALSNLGLTLSIAGAALFIVMSMRRYLRYWLIRLIYEQRDAADRISGH